MKYFVDTWGWIALVNKKEEKNDIVIKKFYEIIGTDKLYTSDYILDETITNLSNWIGFDKLKVFMENLDENIKSGDLNLLWVGKEIFYKAKEYRLTFNDKLEISFTDLTSMALMKQNKITEIITEDSHFEQVGMKFNALFKKV